MDTLTVKVYSCIGCTNTYEQKDQLELHQKVHVWDMPHCCQICFYRFSNPAAFKRDQSIHGIKLPYVCKFCNVRIYYKYKYIKHLKRHLEMKINCEVCGSSFYGKLDLSLHMEIHAETKSYSCQRCSCVFSTKFLLHWHRQIHNYQKPDSRNLGNTILSKLDVFNEYFPPKKRVCKGCSQVEQSSSSLQRMLIDVSEDAYCCKLCGHIFSRHVIAKHHLSIHEKQKAYPCDICFLTYSQLFNLVAHIRTHKKGNLYICPICEYECESKEFLKTHMIQHISSPKPHGN